MTTYRWRFRMMAGYVLPALILLSLCCLHLYRLHRAGLPPGNSLVGEHECRAALVAQRLRECGSYGLRCGAASPARRDVLWSILLAAAGGISVERSARLIALLAGLGVLAVTWKIARRLFPFPPFVVSAAAGAAMVPGIASAVARGSGILLATLLICGAIAVHLQAGQDRMKGFPMLPAFLVGLSGWLYLPYVIVWEAIALHALLPLGVRRWSFSQRALYAVEGALVTALVVSPLFLWNTLHWRVPWLENPAASLSAAFLQGSSGSAWADWHRAASSAYAGLLEAWFTGGAAAGVIPLIPVAAGLLLLVGLGIFGEAERSTAAMVGILIFVLPAGLAVAMPFFSPVDQRELLLPFQPVLAMVAVFGIFRLPFVVEKAYLRWKPGLPAGLGFRPWWIGVCTLVALAWLAAGLRTGAGRMEGWTQDIRRVQAAAQVLGGSRIAASVATDRPGLVHAVMRPREVVDITGTMDPGFLACRRETGEEYWRCLLRKCRRLGSDALILFDTSRAESLPATPDVERLSPEDSGVPLVLRFRGAASGKIPAEGQETRL